MSSDVLDVVDRGTATVDVERVERLPAVDQVLGYPRTPGNYHLLPKVECQCLAARASKLGNLFDGERRALAAKDQGHKFCSHEDNSLTYDVLRTAALEARNRSAGDALNEFYLLALNEGRLDILHHSLVEVRQSAERIETMRRQGLKMPLDDGLLARNEIELRDQQAQVIGGVTQLNMHLWELIGLVPTMPYERLWPQADLDVQVAPQDIEAAVQYGLATRPELGMLRRMQRSLDVDSLGSARAALSQLSPLLGLAPQSHECDGLFSSLKKLHEAREELPARRRQINQYAVQREREVAVEIRQAAEMVDVRLRQVALAKENRDLLLRRRSDAETRAQTGGANFADVTAARIAVWQAEGDLLEKVVNWRIALVKLAQAQGILVAECCP